MSSASIVAIRDLSFCYEGAPEPVFTGLTAQLPAGFTGVVGANGAGKSTLLQILCGQLEAGQGEISGLMPGLYCEQRTDQPPDQLPQMLADSSADSYALCGRLQVPADAEERWQSLSDGERKRVQIAVALWQQPALLAIDEPTNHIDADARSLLLDSLRRFRGVGLIVSHDRELLDELCQQCLWLEAAGATVYPGGYSKAQAQRTLDRETADRHRSRVNRERDRLQRELTARREKASHSNRRRSKRGLARGDHDAKERIDRARVSGKDGQAGRLLRQLDRRSQRAQTLAEAASTEKSYATGIWLPASAARSGSVLVQQPGQLRLNDSRALHLPMLQIAADEHVAITGSNGCGKSTLVRHLLRQSSVPADRLVYLPQEMTAAEGRDALQQVRGLPNQQLGHVMNVVRRLGSPPQRLLDSDQPSPGELRKLLIALGTTREPQLLILDEPTNHLDLPSLNALEEVLAQCPCALVVVTHDHHLLQRLGGTAWHIEQQVDGDSVLHPGP